MTLLDTDKKTIETTIATMKERYEEEFKVPLSKEMLAEMLEQALKKQREEWVKIRIGTFKVRHLVYAQSLITPPAEPVPELKTTESLDDIRKVTTKKKNKL